MTGPAYRLADFIRDLRAATTTGDAAAEVLARVAPLTRALALSRHWLEPAHYACDAEQGFGVHLLHEEPDHRLAIFAGAWLPGRGAPPHNHGTWAVVVGVDGVEKNTLWRRLDDSSRPGHALIRRAGDRELGPGDVATFMPDSIHSVVNETARVTLSLHVYGKHVNYTTRSQFDPRLETETTYIVKVDQPRG